MTGTTLNYNFVVTNGTLTISKALLTAKVDDKSKSYGGANPPLTIGYSGFVNGESLTDIATPPTPSTLVTTQSNVGSYPITVSGGAATNYDFNYVSGTMVVNKAMLMATASSLSKQYLSPNPALTILYSGFVNSEGPDVLDSPPIASTSATSSSPVGNYPITVSSGLDDNYDFTYVTGTLSVISSLAPSITGFQIETAEDSKFVFDYQIFNQHFLSYPGDSIVTLRIVQPTVKGDLLWGGKKLLAGDEVVIPHGKLTDFSYSPADNFNGTDAITWNIFDGTFTATSDAVISITVIPVDDPPVLTNLETEPILYSLGDAPTPVTKNILLSDIDNGFMFSARIALTENYKNGDMLTLDGASKSITSSFDGVKGELLLVGKDSKIG